MWSFSEFFDHFSVEGWNVVGLATRNQSVINHDFLIDPSARPRCAYPAELPVMPYEISTLSGETYEIPHPDFILAPPKGSYVVVIDPKDPKEAPNHISALLIERATPLDGQQRRKTRERS